MTDTEPPGRILPIDVASLLYARGIESSRIEFKGSWDAGAARGTAAQVIHTICAFANDVQNLNGGYIVIGVEEKDGVAQLPPAGIDPAELDSIQQALHSVCNGRMRPAYQPVLSPEIVDGRTILVIWAPGGQLRPYQAPRTWSVKRNAEDPGYAYYVRHGSKTVEAQGTPLTELMQLTATVPFDDRRAQNATLEDLGEGLVRSFLKDVGSHLVEVRDAALVYRRMQISARLNGHEVPRNVGLLCFSGHPEDWMRGARIEVAQFPAQRGGKAISEQTFRGSLIEQLRACLGHLRNLSTLHVEKLEDRPETRGWVSYPQDAFEEAVVNAVYHRSYDGVIEPTKVYLYPDRMVITSYPGPVSGLEPRHFAPGANRPQAPARNRRIGEFLKELQLAEMRNTGVDKIFESMERSGSPTPSFDFDDERTYFQVTLPAHPEYVAISALRDAAHLRAIGDARGSIGRLRQAFADNPGSGTIAAALLESLMREQERFAPRDRDLNEARRVYEEFAAQPLRNHEERAALALASALIGAERLSEARELLGTRSLKMSDEEAIEAAILARRANQHEEAHRFFTQAGDAVWRDVRALHEFAQCKVRLAEKQRRDSDALGREVGRNLLRDAEAMLRRVLQMDAPAQRRAWAWYDLGRVRRRLGAPASSVQAAFDEAERIAPQDERLAEALRRARGQP